MSHSFASVLKSSNLAHLVHASRAVQGVPTRRVAFVLREHFSMMTFTIAMDTLAMANQVSASPLFEILIVGDRPEVVSDSGIAIPVNTLLAGLEADQLDLLLVCGGFRVRLQGDAVIRGKLRQAEQHGCLLGGLWSGAYFLAEAGMLNAQECAFHPDGRAMMSELFPQVRISRHSHVLDRRRMSCAGASSAMELMLVFLEQCYGQALFEGVVQILAADKPQSSLFAFAPELDPALPASLKLAVELMSANIEEPIDLDEICGHINQSRRQLERIFRRHLHSTPLRYYMELRLTHARQLLQHTSKSMSEVALASGFTSFSHFYKRFTDLFAMPPRQFRARSRGWTACRQSAALPASLTN